MPKLPVSKRKPVRLPICRENRDSVNYTMFVPEGNYYDCNGCGERFWGIAFKVEGKVDTYCLDCKDKGDR